MRMSIWAANRGMICVSSLRFLALQLSLGGSLSIDFSILRLGSAVVFPPSVLPFAPAILMHKNSSPLCTPEGALSVGPGLEEAPPPYLLGTEW